MASKKTAKFAVDDSEKAETSMRETARPPTPNYSGAQGIAPSLSEVPTKETAGTSSDFGLTGRDMREAERRLVRKLDLLIMPLTTLMYLAAYLDRGNLGNAKNQGLVEDVIGTDKSGNKYALLSAMFYVSYLVFQIPLTLSAKRFPPNLVLGIVCTGWGVASTLQSTSYNYSGALAARYFLGFFEAGFGPVVPFYYSLWYTRAELGKRTGIFIASAPIAGAFGGLIAYGVQHIHSHIETWRILFLIEGLPTIVLGLLVLLILPSRPESTRWLNEEERALALARRNREVSNETSGVINWSHALSAVLDWKIWIVCFIYQGINVALSSISAFLPTLVSEFGYKGADAQLYTVPPYAAAGGFLLIMCVASDWTRWRGPFIATSMLVSGIGYAIELGVSPENNHARYGAVFLSCMGTYTGIPLALAWVAGNGGSETKRAVGVAMLNTIGHSMSVLGSYIYPKTEAPKYTRGFAICCGFAFWAALLAAGLSVSFRLINSRRDRLEGPPSLEEKPDTARDADRARGYRYII